MKTAHLKVTMIDGLVGNDYSACLCSALHNLGADVELVVPENRSLPADAKYTVLHWMPAKDAASGWVGKSVRYVRYLMRLFLHVIRSRRIMHIQFFRRERMESVFLLVLRLFGARLVFTAHNVLPHENSAIDRWLRKGIYRVSDRIIVHSEYIRRKITAQFPITHEKTQVIPHGNFDHYVPLHPVSRAFARAGLGVCDKENVALFFGFIREYKGLDLLLSAFELCANTENPFHLVIAGAAHPPELETRYRTYIERMPYKKWIIYHPGFVPSERVALYFAACDVVVLPYKAIDHSGIVHLAYSFSRPLIAANVGDFSETIEDGFSGILLKENTASQLALALAEAFTHKDRLEQMGRYARQLSDTKYSWAEAAQRTIDVYQTTTGKEIYKR